MEITIALDKIQNGIMQLTAILGRNRQDMKIAVTPDNLPAIGMYIGEAVTEADNELRRHLKNSNELSLYKNDEAVSFTFTDKLRGANSTRNQIASSIELYLIHYTIARWCATTESLSALAEAYQNSSAGYISKISSLICQRQAYTVSDASYQARDSDTAQLVSVSDSSYQARDSDTAQLVSVSDASYQARDSDTAQLVSVSDASYQARDSDTAQLVSVSDASYQARDSDTICMTNNAQQRKFSTRKRDLQLTGIATDKWPYSAIVSTDPAIITDANDGILIVKPKYD